MRKLFSVGVIFAAVFLAPLFAHAVVDTYDKTKNQLYFPGTSVISDFATDGSTLYIAGGFAGIYDLSGSVLVLDETTNIPDLDFPRILGTVRSAVPDGSGGWYLGGHIEAVDGTAVGDSLVHINADGTLDSGFDAGIEADTLITALAISSDNTVIYAGGSFTTVNGGTTRNRIASFDAATGTATAFDPDIDSAVNSIILSADGTTLYAGGSFTTVNGGATRNRIAAFDTATGTATAFNPNVSGGAGTISRIALSPDGSILYAGGNFTTVNGATARGSIAAFTTADGTVTEFDPNAGSSYVNDISLSSGGGTLYAGGTFTTVNGGTTRNRIAAFDTATGTATAFDPDIDGGVQGLAISSDESTVYVIGNFSSANGGVSERYYAAAFDSADGAITDFNPVTNFMPDIGPSSGSFSSISRIGSDIFFGSTGSVGVNFTPHANLLAIDLSDYSVKALDAGFVPDSESISKIALSPDGGTLYVGGNFTTVNDVTTRNGLAAINTATGEATAFDPNLEHTVQGYVSIGDIAVSSDGSTLFAIGCFDQVNGSLSRNGAAAFSTTDGTATAFDPGITMTTCIDEGELTLNALEISPDDSTIYIGGNFTELNNGGASRNYLAAFGGADGIVTAFNIDPGSVVNALRLSRDGSTLYSGSNSGILTINTLTAASTSPEFESQNYYALDLSTNEDVLYAAPIAGIIAFDTTTGAEIELAAGKPNANPAVLLLSDDHSELFVGGGSFISVGESSIWPIYGFSVFSGDPEELIIVEEPAVDDDDDSSRPSGRNHTQRVTSPTTTPTVSPAETLSALIARLRLMIQEYIAQGGVPSPEMLAFLGGGPTSGSVYTRNLTLGSTGEDVKNLQLFLISQDKGPAAKALARIGATGYFGTLTKEALAEFQASVGISPASGYFGPITRAHVNGG